MKVFQYWFLNILAKLILKITVGLMIWKVPFNQMLVLTYTLSLSSFPLSPCHSQACTPSLNTISLLSFNNSLVYVGSSFALSKKIRIFLIGFVRKNQGKTSWLPCIPLSSIPQLKISYILFTWLFYLLQDKIFYSEWLHNNCNINNTLDMAETCRLLLWLFFFLE